MNDILNSIVRPMADKMLERANLPQNKQIAENWKNVFLNELKCLNYERDINNKIIVKDENGFVLSDEHGWELSIDEVVKDYFNRYFELSKWPINESEYIARLKDPKITAKERIELTNYWEKKRV